MRVPCASMAQVAAEVEPGSEQGSVIATLGMATSVIINNALLTKCGWRFLYRKEEEQIEWVLQ